jgi:hypothetical protein
LSRLRSPLQWVGGVDCVGLCITGGRKVRRRVNVVSVGARGCDGCGLSRGRGWHGVSEDAGAERL